MLKIAIVGSRKLLDYDKFKQAVDEAIPKLEIGIEHFRDVEFGNIEIVSGGATGVDTLARKFAENNKLNFTEFPADWTKYGKAAGPIRNQQIAEYADFCIAIYYKEISRGTKNCVLCFEDLSKKTVVMIVN